MKNQGTIDIFENNNNIEMRLWVSKCPQNISPSGDSAALMFQCQGSSYICISN